jgi:excinuclease ABC subunit C
MLYQIKRCCAPCVGKISKAAYHDLVSETVRFLEGKNSELKETLSAQMEAASQAQNYELALILRDRIRALSSVQSGANVEYADIVSVDAVAAVKYKNMVCIQVFFVRGGQNCGNLPFFPKQAAETSEAEILEAFLSSFYAEHAAPKEILVSTPLENADFLQNALGCKINFYQKGNKAKLIARAVENAKAAIERKLAETASVEENLFEMQRVFGLAHLPQRIEIYDNSHNQGSFAVGAMVVATPSGFDKKSYRTFNIKYTENTHDDFAMMREVLLRRFERMSDENRPDVILLDGGLGQLHAVHEALQNYDLSGITIIAISKGPERNAGKEFYHVIGRESFALPFQSPIAFYMQNLRDEAHRFAIGTHRKKRAKSIYKSQIDEIEGIGAKRKHDLLNFFGSVEQIKGASINDLTKVAGISKKVAEKIYNYFHN